jgi:hypothetical protein
MRKSEAMKWPFVSEDMADNLIEWAAKIKALGDVWGALAWHVEKYDGDIDALTRCGETLGSIIGDYAGFIQDTVTENIEFFFDKEKSVVSPLARAQEVYDSIDKNRQTEDLPAIDYQLKELLSFTENAAMPVMRLQDRFKELKEDIMTKQKSAPAAVSAAAGA